MNKTFLKKQFVKLYIDESNAVFRFCCIRTSDRELSYDITQETFMRFWNMLEKGETIHNERALLFKITRNLIIDSYRKKKNLSTEDLIEKNYKGLDLLLLEDSKKNIMLQAEAHYAITKIQELKQPYQMAVYLRLVEELSPQEIAEILNETSNTISVRINRGIKKLRDILGQNPLK